MVSISNVWDRTIEFVGEQRYRLVPIAFLAILIPSMISDILTEVSATSGQATKLAVGGLSLAAAIATLWGQLAISSLAIDGIGARRASERLLPALGVYLLMAAVGIMVVVALSLALMIGSGIDLAGIDWSNPGQQAVAASHRLGWIALVVPLAVLVIFIAVIVRLSPLTGVIVAERLGVGAIPRSYALTRGLGLRLFGVVLVYAMVSIVAGWAATAVLGSVFELVFGGDGALSVSRLLTAFFTAAVQAVFTVLAAAFAAKLYVACAARDKGVAAPTAAPLS